MLKSTSESSYNVNHFQDSVDNLLRSSLDHFLINIIKIGGLEKNVPATFEIIYHLKGAFINMESIESSSYEINHITKNIQTIIYPPKGMDIQLVQDDTHPNGFKVLDTKAELVDSQSLSETENPVKIGSHIKWNVDNPSLTSKYSIYFKVH